MMILPILLVVTIVSMLLTLPASPTNAGYSSGGCRGWVECSLHNPFNPILQYDQIYPHIQTHDLSSPRRRGDIGWLVPVVSVLTIVGCLTIVRS